MVFWDYAKQLKHEEITISVAPMMDWTDQHCRSFHRVLSRKVWLYTEMVTAQAILHGDQRRLLGRGFEGDRVVLQLGGSDPSALAQAAAIGERFGYQAINLNCGCPSDRVVQGAFGACLMASPSLVAQGVVAMKDAVGIPVTVKHRIGIDHGEDYGFVRDFVGVVGDAGCSHFIVHARNAWLDGLSPKQNRDIPPLRPEVVHRLAADFPGYAFEINGGLDSLAGGLAAAGGLAGAMFGRLAYHQPFVLSEVDAVVSRAGMPSEAHNAGYGTATVAPGSRSEVVEAMTRYLLVRRREGVEVRHLARHMLGLYHGEPAARRWRRMLSDNAALAANDADLLRRARDVVEGALHEQAAEAA
ncbi:MAG: tRNA dihydrouridine(20/20a) synthase DusA [Lautropia sp.]